MNYFFAYQYTNKTNEVIAEFLFDGSTSASEFTAVSSDANSLPGPVSSVAWHRAVAPQSPFGPDWTSLIK